MRRYLFIAAICLPSLCLLAVQSGPEASLRPEVAEKLREPMELPSKLPDPSPSGAMKLVTPDGATRELTIIPELQSELNAYLIQHGNPIASVVMVYVPTGEVVAMVQGRNPSQWDANSHSALYEAFPAASLFKMIITAAALEVANMDPYHEQKLYGGCHDVNARGNWMADNARAGGFQMISLQRAFALSCNGFFAKLAVQTLGVGPIVDFARRFGWGQAVPADFKIQPSPFNPPQINTVGVQSVGRFAAGYGTNVGISPVHAAWINYIISNDGVVKPLRLFRDSLPGLAGGSQVISSLTAAKLRDIMNMTVHRGTATSAFKRKPYRAIAPLVSGKTGTLIGLAPHGSTTWFAGIMTYDDQPEIVVASVVVNTEHWLIKGPNLAAEAFRAWDEYKKREKQVRNLQSMYNGANGVK